jgi:hypothetical protein
VAKKAEAVAKVAKEVDTERKTMGADVGAMLWLQDVVEHDYPAAANYLSLLGDQHTVQAIVDALRKAPIEQHRANDILRAAKLDLLPLDDLSVKRDLSKVLLGRQWSPVLVVRATSSTTTR